MSNRCVRVTEEEYAHLKARRIGTDDSPPPHRKSFTREEAGDNQIITAVSSTVRTLDDAIRVAKVDLAIWEVERFVVNKWDNVAKLKTEDRERLAATELWQVKVWLRRKVSKTTEDGIAALMRRMSNHAPRYPKYKYAPSKKISDPHMLEISINDAHFAKLAWARETGENYDLDIAETLYTQAVKTLISKSSNFHYDKIVLPIGNDLLHFDNLQQTTTAGTQMDTDTRFVKMFEVCQMAVIRAIDCLLTIAPVDVVHVPGNHDKLSSWHIAHTLKAWYRDRKHITINDEPTPRKYVLYGTNLIGYTHGDEEKHSSLPSLMATEVPDLWAKAKTREWHIGHFHRRKETSHINVDSHEGTIIRILASISGRDSWHARKGYIGVRAADAFAYSAENGLAGYFCANVVGERQVA